MHPPQPPPPSSPEKGNPLTGAGLVRCRDSPAGRGRASCKPLSARIRVSDKIGCFDICLAILISRLLGICEQRSLVNIYFADRAYNKAGDDLPMIGWMCPLCWPSHPCRMRNQIEAGFCVEIEVSLQTIAYLLLFTGSAMPPAMRRGSNKAAYHVLKRKPCHSEWTAQVMLVRRPARSLEGKRALHRE